MRRQLGSDIYSAICPEAWETMTQANLGHARAYGQDDWTLQATQLLRQTFETDCDAYFVLSGTLANALALASGTQSYHAVLCHEDAHIFTTECGAPEFFANGARLEPLPGANGKIDPQALRRGLATPSRVHHYKPRALSLTQASERGTVYSLDELKTLIDLAHAHNLFVHMDGARFANALITLNATPRQMTHDLGLDVLSLGGSKTGGAPSEVVVLFNRSLAEDFALRHKQAGQLASKMRYLSAPWVGMLCDGAWLKHAQHANHLAEHLERGLRALEIPVLYPRQANILFADFSAALVERLRQRGWEYILPQRPAGYRLVTAWDNTDQDIDDFLRAVGEEIKTR